MNIQKIDAYLEDLSISFSGVVKKNKLSKGDKLDLCLVDLTYTNTKVYDVREEEDFYFCVIKENQAEFICRSFDYQLEMGDSISVIPNPMRLVNHTKSTIHKIKLPLFLQITGYGYVRENHEL